jgi:hypothetical protein
MNLFTESEGRYVAEASTLTGAYKRLGWVPCPFCSSLLFKGEVRPQFNEEELTCWRIRCSCMKEFTVFND